MAVFDLPNIRPSQFSIGLRSNAVLHQSQFTGSSQTVGRPGSRWVISLTYPTKSVGDLSEIEAFFNSLDGFKHRFRAPVWSHLAPKLGIKGAPLVRGAGQLGNQIVTDGWPMNDLVLSAGDFFNVAGELKQVVADVYSDGSLATISFTPSLRSAPLDNSPLVLDGPTGVFLLSSPETSVATDKNLWSQMAYNAQEIFP